MINVRKQFPVALNSIYANTASSGLLYDDLLEWRQNHDLDFLIGGSEMKMKAIESCVNDTRTSLADFFDCHTSDVALTPNFSIGLNFLLEGLPHTMNVLLLKSDYPSVNWPVESRGFNTHYIAVDEKLEETIFETIRSKNIDVFVFSIVQWINGIKIDLDFVKKLKSEFKDLLIIADGTQFCGMESFSFSNSGIDVLGASGYKWMLGGYGNGFFLFSDDAKLNFTVKSIGNASVMWEGHEKESLPFCRALEPGHLETLNFGSLNFSLNFLKNITMNVVSEHNRELSIKAKAVFTEFGLLEESVAKRKLHSTIFKLKGDNTLLQKLQKNNVICSLRGGGIRLSFHIYNTLDEVDQIERIMKA